MKKLDLLTIFRGRDSITYLAKDFEELGENATPLFVKQNPSERTPFIKFELKDADSIEMHKSLTKADIKSSTGKWDVKALRKLLAPPKNNLTPKGEKKR